jgi:hypothetical protein
MRLSGPVELRAPIHQPLPGGTWIGRLISSSVAAFCSTRRVICRGLELSSHLMQARRLPFSDKGLPQRALRGREFERYAYTAAIAFFLSR